MQRLTIVEGGQGQQKLQDETLCRGLFLRPGSCDCAQTGSPDYAPARAELSGTSSSKKLPQHEGGPFKLWDRVDQTILSETTGPVTRPTMERQAHMGCMHNTFVDCMLAVRHSLPLH